MAFPSPVGGTPQPLDFIPSVTFAILYGLLIPLIIYRLYNRTSRTTLLIGTIVFSVERTIMYSLRAADAHVDHTPPGFVTYMQSDFTLGFVGISSDLVNLLRCLILNTTFGSETQHMAPEIESRLSSRRYEPQYEKLPEGTPDYPRRRFWVRRTSEFLRLGLLAGIVPGVMSSAQYISDIRNPSTAASIGRLRYASAGVALFLTLIILGMTIWARSLPRVNLRAANILSALASLICVVAIYRLSVMEFTTDSLDSTAPGSQNEPIEKIMFYLCHTLPEWLVSFTFFAFNIRQMVGAGYYGDRRWRDETPEETMKREAKNQEKRQKRMAQRDSKKPPRLSTSYVSTAYIPLESMESIQV